MSMGRVKWHCRPDAAVGCRLAIPSLIQFPPQGKVIAVSAILFKHPSSLFPTRLHRRAYYTTTRHGAQNIKNNLTGRAGGQSHCHCPAAARTASSAFVQTKEKAQSSPAVLQRKAKAPRVLELASSVLVLALLQSYSPCLPNLCIPSLP